MAESGQPPYVCELTAAEEQRKSDVRTIAAALPEELPQVVASQVAEAAVPSLLPSGEVVLRYNMYNERFYVKHGCLSAEAIDEIYCLSDVMPGCEIHLSVHSPERKYQADSNGEDFAYAFEDPPGMFHGLEAGAEYYVYVMEDEAEFLRAQEKARRSFGSSPSAELKHDIYGSGFDEAVRDARREAYSKGIVGEAHWAYVQQKMADFNSG